MSRIENSKYLHMDSVDVETRLFELKKELFKANLVVVSSTKSFSKDRLQWQQEQDYDRHSQVLLMTMAIKNEVFSLSETMDIMANVMRKQHELLTKQDKKIIIIEKALVAQGAALNEEEDEDQSATFSSN